MKAKKKLKPKNEYGDVCVYVGRRITPRGKIFQVFIRQPDEREMLFKGVRGVYMGLTYRCSKDSISARPEIVNEVPRKYDPAWEVEDALVDAHYAKKRAQAKIAAASRPAIKNAIEALRPLVKVAHIIEIEALVKYLVAEAWRMKK